MVQEVYLSRHAANKGRLRSGETDKEIVKVYCRHCKKYFFILLLPRKLFQPVGCPSCMELFLQRSQ